MACPGSRPRDTAGIRLCGLVCLMDVETRAWDGLARSPLTHDNGPAIGVVVQDAYKQSVVTSLPLTLFRLRYSACNLRASARRLALS